MSTEELTRSTGIPEWVATFSRPVVRSSTQTGGRVHAPDFNSDSPESACVCGTENTDWVVEEYDPDDDEQEFCQKLRCRIWMNRGVR